MCTPIENCNIFLSSGEFFSPGGGRCACYAGAINAGKLATIHGCTLPKTSTCAEENLLCLSRSLQEPPYLRHLEQRPCSRDAKPEDNKYLLRLVGAEEQD